MNRRLLSLLGIARKAGKLSLGSDAACEAALGGGCPLVLLASDLSPRTARAVSEAAARGKAETAVLRANMDEIGCAIGKRTGVLAVNDIGFAKKLLALNAED
ncbi:50S ribosomal protein L7ae [Caproiciproducens sp. NJN-50]|uniref:L7Ae/L30e/S12e/Gadd45 family ribosomal protein n=1 Tax=Acutalibacteraceae TaxID=3082771 RepID=UPI000FFE154F|nr:MULTISPECIES: ribosomal L7Ae/L30e/S12e/Gadd45 family protein [Acutalibacteraceae]QAT51139.1 50S ribosomal protein L7ae [Caproiciproducens sp. NJN-50]